MLTNTVKTCQKYEIGNGKKEVPQLVKGHIKLKEPLTKLSAKKHLILIHYPLFALLYRFAR